MSKSKPSWYDGASARVYYKLADGQRIEISKAEYKLLARKDAA